MVIADGRGGASPLLTLCLILPCRTLFLFRAILFLIIFFIFFLFLFLLIYRLSNGYLARPHRESESEPEPEPEASRLAQPVIGKHPTVSLAFSSLPHRLPLASCTPDHLLSASPSVLQAEFSVSVFRASLFAKLDARSLTWCPRASLDLILCLTCSVNSVCQLVVLRLLDIVSPT